MRNRCGRVCTHACLGKGGLYAVRAIKRDKGMGETELSAFELGGKLWLNDSRCRRYDTIRRVLRAVRRSAIQAGGTRYHVSRLEV